MRHVSGRVRVLHVCTANICRSPAAERVMRRMLRPSPVGPGVATASAGTHAVDGQPIHPLSDAALRARGFTARSPLSRALSPALIEQADLILTATRRHRSFVVTEVPTALHRTFTLLEFARLARTVDPAQLQGSSPGARLAALALVLGEARHAPPRPADDDLADPIAGPPEGYALMVDRVIAALADATGPLLVGAA